MKSQIDSVRRLLLHSPGDWYCVSTKTVSGKWSDHFFPRSQLSRAIQFIKDHKDRNVYVCPHGFTQKRRVKEFAVDPCLLYADLDETDPRTLSIKPTIAVESSPGRYVGYWLTEKPVPEKLNYRFTYFIGADKSGWDRSQVLRVQGTRNFKYPNKPLVKTLWSDGPRYEVDKLQKMIPDVDVPKDHHSEATDIYEQYEKHLPRWVRKELTNPQVKRGKRSEVLWKLTNEMLEAGMSKEEIFVVLWDNAWNKHAERRGGERQLEREIDKAVAQHISGSKKRKEEEVRYVFKTMAEVEEEEIDWFVPRMIAPAQTTIFEGDPGVGKSYFLMWLCIQLCDGKKLPWQEKALPPKRVLYCDMENSAAAVTKVRLTDNGMRNFQNYVQFEEPFSVDDLESIEAFERDVVEKFKPHIVVIDPINIYVGKADTYKASETQQAMEVLKEMSREHNFALVIVRHLNKSHGGKALYAGGGSIAFAGVARVIATIGWHPEEADTRVVACTKNNLSQPFGSFGYTIEPLSEMKKDRSRLVYEGSMEYTSDEILSTSNNRDESTLAIAMDLLRELLENEDEVNYHSVIQHAESRSISEKSIKKAAAELGLKKIIRGRGKTRRVYLQK